MIERDQFEFYETPDPLTKWLVSRLRARYDGGIHNRHCFEPCVGDGAILRACAAASEHGVPLTWQTNDFDRRWCATPVDATTEQAWLHRSIDWTITNPPFSLAIPILKHALYFSRVGVAMYLRVSIHEPLKTDERRTFFADYPPSAILFLPRFAHQRSKTKGIWSTDSMTSCWVVWHRNGQPTRQSQVIEYAPESVIDELADYTPGYRDRMDALMGLTGTEKERQAQCKAIWEQRKAVA